MRKLKCKYYVLLVIAAFVVLDYCGVTRYFKQLSYDKDFSYPYDGDVGKMVDFMRAGKAVPYPPEYAHSYYIKKNPNSKCLSEDGSHYEQLRLVYLVKSAMNHGERRSAIRKSWGYEGRFSDVPIRTVFLLGQKLDDVKLQAEIEAENRIHGDIVQGDFEDTYFNNTVKTAMGLRWAVESCPKSRFYMFVDDDYFVSTRNVLAYLRNPVNYPGYLKEDVISFDETEYKKQIGRQLNQLVDFDLPSDVTLFTGYVFPRSRPQRHKWSKWYVDLLEYPFDFWPPYVTAGSYILSRDALVDIYFTSYYTRMFRFDDIWLGLVAKKAGIDPFHNNQFYFNPPQYTVQGYKYVIASHGFSDPDHMIKIWNKQKEAGFA